MDNNLGSDNKSKNIITNNSNNIKELNTLERLLIILFRRKKIFLLTIISFVVFGYIRTTREAMFNSSFEGGFTLLISDPINSKSAQTPIGGKSQLFDIGSSLEQDIPTLRELLLSEYILKDIADDFGLNPKNLASRIQIKEDYLAKGVLNVFLQSSQPKEDEKLLKELSKLYVNYATLQKQKKLSDGLAFLSSQEPAIYEKSFKIREKLEIFKKKYNTVDPIAESAAKMKELAALENKMKTSKTKKERLLDIKDDLLQGNLTEAEFSEVINTTETNLFRLKNPEQGIIDQYMVLNSELADALRIYTPNSSIIRNIKARIETLTPLIKEKQIKAIDRAIKAADDLYYLDTLSLAQLNDEFEKYATISTEFAEIEFELEEVNKTLIGLYNAKERLQFEMAQDSKPWVLIKQPKFRGARVYPSFRKELTNFALFGTFAGIGLTLLRDKFDDVYHSPKEIENEINAPILGHVPYVEYFSDIREKKKSLLEAFADNSDGQAINSYDKFFYQEAFRNIYTSIRFINSDNPLQIITLTSSIPKEGKSLTNILLAKTLSEMDLKILLIDADLRKPQLHLRLGLNNITGLSNILTDKEISTTEAIQKVNGFKNWDVITSGTKPPDPTRLLKSQRMDSFITELKKNKKYDLVLIDTPPVIGLADALLVSEKSDGLILIVSTDQVPKNLPKESINRTLGSGAYFIGMITNATKKPQSELINNYQYGAYNYSYTYNTYIEKEEDLTDEDKKQTNAQKIKNILVKNIKMFISETFKWLDK